MIQVIYPALYATCLSIATFLIKFFPQEIETMALLQGRYTSSMLMLFPIMLFIRPKLPGNLHLYALRTILVIVGTFCTFYGYRNLPISLATCIGSSEPLFTTIITLIFTKSKVSLKESLCVLLGYVGVFFCLYDSLKLSAKFWPILSLLCANFIAGCGVFMFKYLISKEEASTIIFWGNLFVWIAISITFFSTGGRYTDATFEYKSLFLFFLIGIAATLTSLFSIMSLKNVKPHIFSAFQYSRIVIAAILDLLIFKQLPTFKEIIGSTLILCGISFLTYYRRK